MKRAGEGGGGGGGRREEEEEEEEEEERERVAEVMVDREEKVFSLPFSQLCIVCCGE